MRVKDSSAALLPLVARSELGPSLLVPCEFRLDYPFQVEFGTGLSPAPYLLRMDTNTIDALIAELSPQEIERANGLRLHPNGHCSETGRQALPLRVTDAASTKGKAGIARADGEELERDQKASSRHARP